MHQIQFSILNQNDLHAHLYTFSPVHVGKHCEVHYFINHEWRQTQMTRSICKTVPYQSDTSLNTYVTAALSATRVKISTLGLHTRLGPQEFTYHHCSYSSQYNSTNQPLFLTKTSRLKWFSKFIPQAYRFQ